jgi:hypothetical protein
LKIGVEEKHKFAVDLVVDRQGTSINGFNISLLVSSTLS